MSTCWHLTSARRALDCGDLIEIQVGKKHLSHAGRGVIHTAYVGRYEPIQCKRLELMLLDCCLCSVHLTLSARVFAC